MQQGELQDGVAVRRVLAQARCSSSTASSPCRRAWQRQGPERRGEGGIDLQRRWMGRWLPRPAGKFRTKPSTCCSTALSGASSSACRPRRSLVVMAEAAQRQRAVAQDLAAAGGIVAGIDQGHVQHLRWRGP
jgi:hypothetical protein